MVGNPSTTLWEGKPGSPRPLSQHLKTTKQIITYCNTSQTPSVCSRRKCPMVLIVNHSKRTYSPSQTGDPGICQSFSLWSMQIKSTSSQGIRLKAGHTFSSRSLQLLVVTLDPGIRVRCFLILTFSRRFSSRDIRRG